MGNKILAWISVSVILISGMAYTGVSVEAAETFSITYNLTGVTVSSEDTEIEQNGSLDVTFTPESGYSLPDEIEVSIGGAVLSDGYTYANGELIVDEVYGDITITVTGVAASSTCNIEYDLYQVSASKQDSTVEAGTSYSVKLKADSGYKLKEKNVSVVVDGAILTDGYSYDDGVLTIDEISGDTIIEAIAVKKSSASKNSSNNSRSEKTTSSKKKTSSSGNSGKSLSNTTTSKSAQALKASGQSARDYTTGTYVAPKTGQIFDIRYLAAMGLILIGAGVMCVRRIENNTK